MRLLSVNCCGLGLTLAIAIGLPISTVQAQFPSVIKLTQNAIAGVWESSEGDIIFQQSDSDVSATYTQDSGVLEGKMSNNVLTGYWIEETSNRRCDTPRNGSYYWGRIVFVFEGSSFTGLWGYCEDQPKDSWTGNRKL